MRGFIGIGRVTGLKPLGLSPLGLTPLPIRDTALSTYVTFGFVEAFLGVVEKAETPSSGLGEAPLVGVGLLLAFLFKKLVPFPFLVVLGFIFASSSSLFLC